MRVFDNGYVQVADEDAYVDGLATLVLNRDLPYAWDLEAYQSSEALKERLEDGFALVPDAYKDETIEIAPFLKEVVEPASLTDAEIAETVAEDTARREADSFVIDESQFDINPQQGLQQ